MCTGAQIDFFEPLARCDDARRDGGFLLPRSLLFAAWVVKSHRRRSSSSLRPALVRVALDV